MSHKIVLIRLIFLLFFPKCTHIYYYKTHLYSFLLLFWKNITFFWVYSSKMSIYEFKWVNYVFIWVFFSKKYSPRVTSPTLFPKLSNIFALFLFLYSYILRSKMSHPKWFICTQNEYNRVQNILKMSMFCSLVSPKILIYSLLHSEHKKLLYFDSYRSCSSKYESNMS